MQLFSRFSSIPSAAILIAIAVACGNNVSGVTAFQSQHRLQHKVQHHSAALAKSSPAFHTRSQRVNDVSSDNPVRTHSRSTTHRNAVMEIIGVSPEPIHTAFAVATFLPQPFWLLITLLPDKQITKQIMGSLNAILLCALLHFTIVVASVVIASDFTAPLDEFNNVFDLDKDTQAAFMNMVTNYPNFVAEEWPHVLTWDLFVGRWIWLDGLKRGVFTGHSVLLTNLIGPPGLLAHFVTCLVTGSGFVENEADEL